MDEVGVLQARQELLDELDDLGLVGLHGHGELGEPDVLAVARVERLQLLHALVDAPRVLPGTLGLVEVACVIEG